VPERGRFILHFSPMRADEIARRSDLPDVRTSVKSKSGTSGRPLENAGFTTSPREEFPKLSIFRLSLRTTPESPMSLHHFGILEVCLPTDWLSDCTCKLRFPEKRMTAEIRRQALMERILILEDDAANLRGITDVLRSEDYSVLAAATGLQAIEIGAGRGPISLFITDMDLPVSSGTEIALRLVALYPDLPVHFIYGTPMVWWTSRNVSNFEQFPPYRVSFVEKPFSVAQLLTKVRTLIGAGRHSYAAVG
jgi:CheY-like chemotaxis protein